MDTLAGMHVLVIGSGAREHALCLALHADPAVSALTCAPGHAGTSALIRVPAPGALATVTVPPASETRACIPRSP